MADNTVLDVGSGGDTIATDDIGGIKFPRSKITIGVDGTNDGDVAQTNPLPVRVSDGTVFVDTIPVNWAGTSPPIGAGTEAAALRVTIATDSTGLVSVDNDGTFAVQVDGDALTALQLIDDAVYADDADWTDATSKHLLVGGLYQSSPQTVTDGDVAPFNITVNGALHTAVQNTVTVAAHDVTNAGTFAVQSTLQPNSGVDIGDVDVLTVTPGTAAGQLGKAEDAVHTTGDVGVMALGVRQNTATALAGTDGDYMPMIFDTNGRLHVNVGNTVTVGSHAVTNAGTFAVQLTGSGLTALQLIDDTVYTDDADWTDGSSKHLLVGGLYQSSPQTVTNGDVGPFNMTVNGALHTAVQNTVTVDLGANNDVQGDVAHDTTDSGNPHKIGAKAETALSGITLVADGDRTDLHAGVDGVLLVRNHCNLEDVVAERDTNTDGASTAFASGMAAPGAGVRLWVTAVTLANSSATNITVDLRDGAAGSVLWTIPVPANGGAVQTFDPPLKLTANTALAYDGSAAVSTLYISANGFKSKV